MMRDKTRKIQCGLVKVNEDSEMRLQTGMKAIMVVDADDRVNHNLAQWVKNNQSGHGWYFDTGIIYPHGANFLFTSTVLGSPFYKHCGTSFITYCRSSDLPSHVSDDDTYLLPAPHHTIVSYMDKNGKSLKPLPFRGACYVTDTGDNHSGVSWLQWKGKKKFLKQMVSIRPLLPYYKKRFAL